MAQVRAWVQPQMQMSGLDGLYGDGDSAPRTSWMKYIPQVRWCLVTPGHLGIFAYTLQHHPKREQD